MGWLDLLAGLVGQLQAPPPEGGEFAPAIAEIAQQYPRIGQQLGKFKLQWGPPQADDRQLETYPPEESWNPNPGYWTTELYRRDASPAELRDMLAGDALHYFGAQNWRTQQPNDPEFYKLKQALIGGLTPEQLAVDRRAYAEAAGEGRSFEDFMQGPRADAYIRGNLFPDAADEWRRDTTPAQTALFDKMRAHLQEGPEAQARSLFRLALQDQGPVPDIYHARKILGPDLTVQPKHVRAYQQYLATRPE